MARGMGGGGGLVVLGISVLLSAGVLIASGVRTLYLNDQAMQRATAAMQRESVRGTLVQLDEILSMSAWMAATTGEERWRERYAAAAERLAPLDTPRAATQIEARALALVEQGEMDSAQRRLGSADYARARDAFARGVEWQASAPSSGGPHLKRLRATILHLDEVLTMSARLAAVTGNLEWERRYDHYEPLLAAALLEAVQRTSAQPSRKTDAANGQLVALERQSFDLVREGKGEEARALLFSPRYELLKQDYAEGMASFDRDLQDEALARLSAERERALLEGALSLSVVLLLALGWGFIFQRVRTWRALILERNDALARQRDELQALNQSLDERVALRTRDLELAHSQTDELRRTHLEGVLRAQDEERRRVARELHDGIGQVLTSQLVELRALESSPQVDLSGVRQGLSGAIEELGRLAKGLHPAILDHLGFAAALEHLSAETFRHAETRVDVVATGFTGDRLPTHVELALYRICQEALRNVRVHADAGSVSVVAERQPAVVRLVIEDDGVGIAGEQPDDRGLGLVSMRERIAQLGGSLTLESRPGQGTSLFFEIPLSQPEPLVAAGEVAS